MTAIVWSDVTSAFPADATALGAVPSNIQTAILAHVNTALDTARFPQGETDPRLFLCRINMLAHLVMSNAFGAFGAAGGPVIAESGGRIARQYANNVPMSSSGYASTAYGRTYLTLIKPLGGGFAMSGAYVFPPPLGDC